MLQNNKIRNLVDIDEIAKMKRLKCLIMKGNPVCAVENYRAYCIYKLNDGLKMLDYERVSRRRGNRRRRCSGRTTEKRRRRKRLRLGREAGEMMMKKKKTRRKKTKKKPKNNAAELAKIKAAIANATTLEEIAMLEKAMETGKMPSEYNK